jgi:hypothetical protein
LNGLVPSAGFNCARRDGNITGDEAVSEKVSHVSAQAAIDAQPSIAMSQGLALCGQQSMSSMAAISVESIDFMTALPPPAAGSIATDRAIMSANMIRPIFMLQENSRFGALEVK